MEVWFLGFHVTSHSRFRLSLAFLRMDKASLIATEPAEAQSHFIRALEVIGRGWESRRKHCACKGAHIAGTRMHLYDLHDGVCVCVCVSVHSLTLCTGLNRHQPKLAHTLYMTLYPETMLGFIFACWLGLARLFWLTRDHPKWCWNQHRLPKKPVWVKLLVSLNQQTIPILPFLFKPYWPPNMAVSHPNRSNPALIIPRKGTEMTINLRVFIRFIPWPRSTFMTDFKLYLIILYPVPPTMLDWWECHAGINISMCPLVQWRVLDVDPDVCYCKCYQPWLATDVSRTIVCILQVCFDPVWQPL